MDRVKQAVIQGEINGMFEIHFGTKLKPKARITSRLCHAWIDKIGPSIIGGERRNDDLVRLFREHFPIESGPTPGTQNLWDLWCAWEEKVRNISFPNSQPPS